MSAGISYSSKAKLLSVVGTSANDMLTADYARAGKSATGLQSVDKSRVVVRLLTGQGKIFSRTVRVSGVGEIRFDGKGGQDFFQNLTTVKMTAETTEDGRVDTSMLTGSPGNTNPEQDGTIGEFTVGTTGKVNVDYLFRGAGYSGQLAIFSLSGMEEFKASSPEFRREAAKRALSGSTLGHVVISAARQGARFSSSLPWEGNLNRGTYTGVHSVEMEPGSKFAVMLVPNGLVSDVAANPSLDGAKMPLFSIPGANPYANTPQMRGQIGDLDGHGSVFAMEDLRLDEGSDRDYNDITFQITGASGVAPLVSEVAQAGRDFSKTPVGLSIQEYGSAAQGATSKAVNGSYSSGVFTAETEPVTLDLLFRGGTFVGEMGIFSLAGMGQYEPGSAEFIKEASRRALSQSALGQVVATLATDAARHTAKLSWDGNQNKGSYKGLVTLAISAGDTFGMMLVPRGSIWATYNNPNGKDTYRPLFSMPEANPTEKQGNNYMLDLKGDGRTMGWEDMRFDKKSDRDHNDVIVRLNGASAVAPLFSLWVNPEKDLRNESLWAELMKY